MKNIIFLLFLLAISSCSTNDSLTDIDVQPNTPIDFKFSSSSFSIVDSKRQGASGKNFEIGDTLLIGQYKTKTDGTRDNASAHDARYYTVTGFDEGTQRITGIAPIGTPLSVLSSADSYNGQAFYIILSGGNGEAFPLSVFDHVDVPYALDYENINYNYDILTQSTDTPNASETVTFDDLEHLCVQINIIIDNPANLRLDSVTYQDVQLTKEFTPVFSNSVEYIYNSKFNISKGYELMKVTDEGGGIDYRGFILPTPADGPSLGSEGVSHFIFHFEQGLYSKLAFFVPLEAGLSYTITVTTSGYGGSSTYAKEGTPLQIKDISVEPY